MNAWRNVWTITKRELGAYFMSPLAYVFIVIFLLLCGFFTFFVGGFFERQEASLVRPFFDWHPWFYLFLVPAVGMRLWAEERHEVASSVASRRSTARRSPPQCPSTSPEPMTATKPAPSAAGSTGRGPTGNT